MDWIEERIEQRCAGRRGTSRGAWRPEILASRSRITTEMVEELRRLSPFDPEHLPEEILLTEAFHRRFPDLPQIACFDTAFHHDLPRVAQLLPIPRRYEAQGVRRYGFHGLSYAYLMEELARVAGAEAAQGRVILAHLGNGASLAAVRDGKAMDTSMGFTPTAGLPMSTRTGDLDPGLVWYLARTEQMNATQFQRDGEFHESGLLGVSETSSDMRDLLAREATMCGRRRRWRCFATRSKNGSAPSPRRWADWTRWSSPAASAKMRRQSARASAKGWASSASSWMNAQRDRMRRVISTDASRVTVRVMRTDEELMIAEVRLHRRLQVWPQNIRETHEAMKSP